MYKALVSLYPDCQWFPWEQERMPRGQWESLDVQRKFLCFVENKLKMKGPEDWYNVTQNDFRHLG